MSVTALLSLIASPHPLGYEIDLQWQLPATLPDNFQIVVFRKKTSNVSALAITNYFDSPSVPTTGVNVFVLDGDDDPLYPYGMNDFDVVNSSVYYYRVVVYDVTGDDHSTTADANATPSTSITTVSVDAKQAVMDAVKRLFTAYGLKEKKHYTIHRGYSIEAQKPLAVYVTRTSGQVLHNYLGNISRNSELGQLVSTGNFDVDIIQVIFEDPHDLQRDDVMMMFREGREALRRYLMNDNGGKIDYVDVLIEGDVINQSIKDRIQVGGMVVFQCGIETTQQFTEDMASWYEGEGVPVI